MSNETGVAVLALGATVAAGFGARFVAPDLDSPTQLRAFEAFFSAAAPVIAALLIAIAIEATFVVRQRLLAVVTFVSVGVGEVCAMAALSPVLPTWMYDWLFTLTVAGGVGGLVAAIVIGAQTLSSNLGLRRAAELEALLQRNRQDQNPNPLV